jgi:hypothetical protein
MPRISHLKEWIEDDELRNRLRYIHIAELPHCLDVSTIFYEDKEEWVRRILVTA